MMGETTVTGGMVTTVTGPLPASALGPALMHEHLLCDITHPRQRPAEPLAVAMSDRHALALRPTAPGVYRLTDEAVAASELRIFAAAGGGAVVDVTSVGIAPDREGLARVSRASGVPVVAGAGFYYDAYVPGPWKAAPVEALTERILADLQEGPARAGIIGEVGVSWPITAFETRSLAAAARAQRATGAAITVHPPRDPRGCDAILRLLDAEGADLSRVVLGHMDRTFPRDPEAVVALARRCVVEYDFFGLESSYWIAGTPLPTDAQRFEAIRRLFDAGLERRVVVSQDICTVTRLTRWGGHGYAHLLRDAMPLARSLGFGEAEIARLTVENPRRLLAI